MPGPLITQLLLALPCPEKSAMSTGKMNLRPSPIAPEYSYICRCHCDAGWQVTISVVYKLSCAGGAILRLPMINLFEAIREVE